MIRRRDAALAAALAPCGFGAAGAIAEDEVRVDTRSPRHPISPLIYGVNWGSARQLEALNVPLNRHGGNATSRYNWRINAANRGRDWYFQSTPSPDPTPGALTDRFVQETRAAAAEPMLTVPLMDWTARLGPGRAKLASFSIAKYGEQAGRDEAWFRDAGNGLRPDGTPVTGNDPRDANQRVGLEDRRQWIEHLVRRWGRAGAGGVCYYLLDNEPSLWHSTHRDVQPVGLRMEELRDRLVATATMIKGVDPGARICGPEEWGWSGYFHSGYDLQWGQRHGWRGPLPDRAANGGMPYLPWLLRQVRQAQERTGRRALDVFSVHYYPQGGESSDDTSAAAQRQRARSTRSLWDPAYRDESWIDDHVRLIPRLREWVAEHCPGLATGITEYDWGAQHHISGALAQADVLGIFGRERLDLAARWEAPEAGSPVFNAMRMYRNYDGMKSAFGDISLAARVRDPDTLAAFAAERRHDGTLTVMLVNKDAAQARTVRLIVEPATGEAGNARHWQLTARNLIERRDDLAPAEGRSAGHARWHWRVKMPAQSLSLILVARSPRAAAPALRA